MVRQSYDLPKVSVVTVCLNAQSTIEATLRNVRRQSYANIEQVVVDGGSVDQTCELIRTIGVDRFISEHDDGIYAAMDKGAKLASGSILFFLNSGDLFYSEDVVSEVVRYFDETGADAVFGNLLPYRPYPGVLANHKAFAREGVLDYSYFRNRRFFFLESIHHQTVFYRKEIFDCCRHVSDLPEATGEYHLHMMAFVKMGYKLRHMPAVICRFALGGVSTSNYSEEWSRFKIARDRLRKAFFADGPKVPRDAFDEYYSGNISWPARMRAWKRHLLLAVIGLRYGQH